MRTFRDARLMARALRAELAQAGIDISHSRSLEIVAAQLGLPDWNVLAARIGAAGGAEGSGAAFQGAIPILRIFDLAKSREFHCGFLGLAEDWEHRFGPDFPAYLQVSRAGPILHLTEHRGDASPGGTAFVWMQGLDDFHAEITGRGYPYPRPGIETWDLGSGELGDARVGMRVMEVTDGRPWDSQHLGRLCVGHLLEVDEMDHLPLLLWPRPDRGFRLAQNEHRLGCLVAVHDRGLGRVYDVDLGPPRGMPAGHVDPSVAQDPEEPGVEARGGIVLSARGDARSTVVWTRSSETSARRQSNSANRRSTGRDATRPLSNWCRMPRPGLFPRRSRGISSASERSSSTRTGPDGIDAMTRAHMSLVFVHALAQACSVALLLLSETSGHGTAWADDDDDGG